MIVWIIPAFFWMVAVVVEKLGYNIPFLSRAHSEQIKESLEFVWASAFFLWAFVWRPFEQYDALERELNELKKKPLASLKIEEAGFITEEEASFAVFVRVSNKAENKTADDVHLTLISVGEGLACNTGNFIHTPIPVSPTVIKAPSINPGANATFRLGTFRVSKDGNHVFTLNAEPGSYYLNIVAEKSYRISFQATARDFPPYETECELILKGNLPLVGFFITPKPR